MDSLDNVRSLWRNVRTLAHGRLQLLALEVQRAVRGLAAIAAYSVATGLLIAGAWLGVMAALALWLIEHQVSASSAVLLAAIFNGVGVWALVAAIRKECRAWGFSASLQALEPLKSAPPSPPSPPAEPSKASP